MNVGSLGSSLLTYLQPPAAPARPADATTPQNQAPAAPDAPQAPSAGADTQSVSLYTARAATTSGSRGGTFELYA